MKNIFVITLLLIGFIAKAGTDTTIVKSEIEKVTVFLKGGEVIRGANVQLPIGTSVLIFNKLSPHLDANSIQLDCNKDVTILSVVRHFNFLETVSKSEKVKSLEIQRKNVTEEMEFQQSMIKVYRQEEELILANKKLSSEQLGVNIDELQKATAFYREKLTEIKVNQLNCNKKVAELNLELVKLQSQLDALNSKQAQQTSEIYVTLSTKNATSAKLSLSYFNSECGWMPKYNLRVKNVDSPLELNYKAEVYQKTGYDWKNIEMVLSTGEPLKNGTKPKLERWVINKGSNVSGSNSGSSKNFTNTSFQLKTKYNIPTDGQNYSADLIDYSIPATYKYSCVPKIEEAAFLMAQIADWEKYNLLSGQVNLFFEGTFVGKSLLDVTIPEDTLIFSLGRDKNVIVKREKLDEYNKTQFLGNKKIEMFAWEINIRNNKRQDIDLTIEDQVPVSSSREIDVKYINLGNAKHDEETGILKWNVKLSASENKKYSFKYEVKYPTSINMEL